MLTLRIRSVVRWLPTVLIATLASYLVLAAAAWCWDGAYNVLQGDSPAYGFSAVLIVAGLLPIVAAAVYCVTMRRSGQPLRSSVAFASLIALISSIVVLFLRAGASGGF